MNPGPAPQEFYEFVGNFWDYDADTFPFGSKEGYELYMRNALKALTPAGMRVLARYLDTCLSGGSPEDDLMRLWRSGNPHLVQKPIAPLFRDIRSRLRTLGY